MIEDLKTVFSKDPAARSFIEALCCYPGVHAMWLHRVAHKLWEWGGYFPARFISHISRGITGIEIHPGAKIGRRFFIDHGMGVVIGETTEIGDDVLIYQGVVLGGTSLEKKKRHPTVGHGVVIGAGAIVLGAINIGAHARIGAGSVVLKDVPPNTTVFGVPARASRGGASDASQLDHYKVHDFYGEEIQRIKQEIEQLKEAAQKK
ncbi:MAG: serine O-acetyltransferase [Elusimicrobia bacterium]|nr:serine O-acetyltransferase [Elusimicrobiota bacterium]